MFLPKDALQVLATRFASATQRFRKIWLIMAYVPENTRWYLADIVLEHQIEGDARNVIHINTVLVRANSPERAYARAMKLGREADREYQNSEDKTVRTIFRGLRDLLVIYEPLRSGSELIYEERVNLSKDEVAALVRSKDELDVFEAWQKPSRDKPNYMPKSIMELLEEAGFSDDDIYE